MMISGEELGFIAIINAYEPLIIVFCIIIVVSILFVLCYKLGEVKNECERLNAKLNGLESFWKLFNETNKILINSNTIQHETYKIIRENNKEPNSNEHNNNQEDK